MVFENISFDKQLQLKKLNYSVSNKCITSPFRIVYAGDINYERHIEKLLKAFVNLEKDYELHIVGEGLDFLRLKNYISSLDSQKARRILIYGRVPRSQLIDIYAICHVGFVGYPNVGLNNINCASNKIYEYLEGGLIVLASDNPPLERVVSKLSVGLIVKEMETDSISTQIEFIKENYNEFIENVRITDFTEVVRQIDLEYSLNLKYFNITDGRT
jgi:glycosyltransferase involved in cell wall biosynthesis